MDQPQGEGCGHAAPVGGEAAAGTVFGLHPCDQAVVGPQPPALAQVAGAGLMQAHDGVDAGAPQGGDGGIGAESPVGEDDVVGQEEGEELAEQLAFMHMLVALGPVQPGAAGEAEASDDLGDGEAAAPLLVGGLRESLLILRRVGHGDAGSVDDRDAPAAPELLLRDAPLQFVGGVAMDAEQGVEAEARTGAAVRGGARAGPRLAADGIPRLDFADGLAAGTLGREHLRKECPEGQPLGKEAATAVRAAWGGLQQPRRHPRRAHLAELAQRGLLKRPRLVGQLRLRRTPGAAEEQTVETGKEWCCLVHA